MPQELALFLEFSIEETLIYFARIYGMTRAKFKERLIFLMDFLDLPSSTRILENMSGGQQRRASLAVALLHEPELLILDEPTVSIAKKKLERLYLLPLPLHENHKKVIRSRSVNKFSFSVTYEVYSKPSMIKPRHKTESVPGMASGPITTAWQAECWL